MKQLIAGLGRFAAEEDGVTMVEYGLIAALIAVVCIVAITAIGTNLNKVFEFISGKLAAAVPAAPPPAP